MKQNINGIYSELKDLLGCDFMGLTLEDNNLILSTTNLHDYIVNNHISPRYKITKFVYQWDEEDYECTEWIIIKS